MNLQLLSAPVPFLEDQSTELVHHSHALYDRNRRRSRRNRDGGQGETEKERTRSERGRKRGISLHSACTIVKPSEVARHGNKEDSI